MGVRVGITEAVVKPQRLDFGNPHPKPLSRGERGFQERGFKGAVDYSATSLSILAAQMKSFSDRPPMAWVEKLTLQWP